MLCDLNIRRCLSVKLEYPFIAILTRKRVYLRIFCHSCCPSGEFRTRSEFFGYLSTRKGLSEVWSKKRAPCKFANSVENDKMCNGLWIAGRSVA